MPARTTKRTLDDLRCYPGRIYSRPIFSIDARSSICKFNCLLIRHLEFDPIRVLFYRRLAQPGDVLSREQTVSRLVVA
jgi:hypothetical protein